MSGRDQTKTRVQGVKIDICMLSVTQTIDLDPNLDATPYSSLTSLVFALLWVAKFSTYVIM